MAGQAHVPVLADRVTALLAPALAARTRFWWTPPWAGPGTPAPCWRPVLASG